MATELAGQSLLTPEEKDEFARVRAGNQLDAERAFVALRRGSLADLAMIFAGVAGSLLVTRAVVHFIPTKVWRVPVAPAIGSAILLTAGAMVRVDASKRATLAGAGAVMLVGAFMFDESKAAP